MASIRGAAEAEGEEEEEEESSWACLTFPIPRIP